MQTKRSHTDVSEIFALNIHRQVDVKLNELPKQIFMLLPLRFHWLYFSILGADMPARMEKMKHELKFGTRAPARKKRWLGDCKAGCMASSLQKVADVPRPS